MRRNGDILYDLLDSQTGEYEAYEKVTTLPSGETITDANVLPLVPIYRKSGTEYFKKASANVRPVSVKEFGAKGDGIQDDAPFIQSAIKFAENQNGGTIVFPSGRYKVNSEILIEGSGITLQGMSKQGKQFGSVVDRDRGSYIFPGAPIVGSIFKYTITPSGIPSRSNSCKDLSFLGGADGAFFFPVDSAVRVARSDQFTMTGCTFERIQGTALHVSGTIKSCFTDIDVFQSGDTGKPAVDIGAVEGPVQGSFFDKFRVESCFSTYVNIVNTETCKYDNFVLETAPGAATQHTMLNFEGTNSQWGKVHFNKTDSDSDNYKIIIAGNGNIFDSIILNGGHSNTVPAMLLSGQGNIISFVSDGSTNSTASLEVTGSYNNITGNIRFSGGVLIGGVMNNCTVRQVSSPFQSVLSGTECILDIQIDGNNTALYPLSITGTQCRVDCMITDCVNAIAAVINSGNNNTIANISIRNVPNGIEINGGTRIGMAHFASVSGQEYVFTSGSLNTLMSPITSGATASRPANPPVRGYSYFDATLGIPIYWNGTAWVDAAGTLV